MKAMEESLKRAADQNERDAIYTDMAAAMASSGDPRANDARGQNRRLGTAQADARLR